MLDAQKRISPGRIILGFNPVRMGRVYLLKEASKWKR